MGFIKKAAIILGTLLTVLGIGVGVAFAAGSDSTVSGTTNHTVYKAGPSVTITGTVNGDIFCAGQTVTIDATVNGDVICAGQSVTITGTVNGNVRVVGQTVNIGANVERNGSLAAQDFSLQSNGRIGSDLAVAGQTVTIDGLIGRDLRGAGNTLALNNTIGRNVDAAAQKLELGGSARLGGNLTYTSPRLLKQSGGASIAGSVTYHKSKPVRTGHQIARLWVFRSLYVDLALLVFSMVLVALLPQLFVRLNKTVASKPWTPLLTGFVAAFVVPVLIVASVLTLVGVPLAVFIGLAWTVLLFLSAPVSAFYVGQLILRQEKRVPLIMLLGSLVLGLVGIVPILGGLVTILAVWFGAGTLLLNLKTLYKKPQYRI